MKALAPLFITLLIQSFSALGMLAVPVLVPVETGLTGAEHLSPAGIGMYLLCAYIGAVLGSLSCGPLIEHWGTIRTSQAALSPPALGLMLAVLLPDAVFVAAVLVGLGHGPITPASSHVLIQTTPAHKRNLVFSVKQTGVPAPAPVGVGVGVGLSGFCIPSLVAQGGWIGVLLWLAAACAVVAASAHWIQAELDAQTSPLRKVKTDEISCLGVMRLRASIRRFSAPLLVIARAPQLAFAGSNLFRAVWHPDRVYQLPLSFLTPALLMPTLVEGSVLALSQLGGIIGRIFFGYLSERLVNPLVMLKTVALIIAAAAFTTALLSIGGSAVEMAGPAGYAIDL